MERLDSLKELREKHVPRVPITTCAMRLCACLADSVILSVDQAKRSFRLEHPDATGSRPMRCVSAAAAVAVAASHAAAHTFTVMQFNVLADSLAVTAPGEPSHYPYASPRLLAWPYRGYAALHCVWTDGRTGGRTAPIPIDLVFHCYGQRC
jgi:hypothetical protein